LSRRKEISNPKLDKQVNYTLDNPNKITFAFLKTHLWNTADILRGSLDASEYRQPIMTVLFLKRLNDTFEENAERLIKKGMNKKEAYSKRRHYFYILLRSHIIIINNLSLFSFCC
jgi:type I restriction enzyme M protein